MNITKNSILKIISICWFFAFALTSTALPPKKFKKSLALNSKSVALPFVQEEFASYQPGALEIVSNGIWQRTIGTSPSQVLAVPLHIADRYSSSNSINVSGQNVGYDY